MKKFSLQLMTLFVLSLFLFCKNDEDATKNVFISGEVNDFPEGVMTLYRVFDEDSTIVDTSQIKNGIFSFALNDSETRLATVVFPDGMSAVQFFTEPGNISIKGNKEDIARSEATGTPTNELNTEFKKMNQNIESKYSELMEAGNAANEIGNTKTVDSISGILMNLEKETNIKNIEFARKNPGSMLSAYIGLMAGSSGTVDKDLTDLYTELTQEVKNSFFGTRLKAIVEAAAKTALGAVAPDFEGLTPDGKLFKLSSMKGKHVLIDFWASWCGPCRQENPNVVKAYNNFNSKGFEILGVSLDQEKDKWIGAIAQDGLNWPHVSDLKGWKSTIAAMYGVQGIPQNFLIDKEGKILAKGLRGEALNQKLIELMN